MKVSHFTIFINILHIRNSVSINKKNQSNAFFFAQIEIQCIKCVFKSKQNKYDDFILIIFFVLISYIKMKCLLF